jgi:hypothetical protein
MTLNLSVTGTSSPFQISLGSLQAVMDYSYSSMDSLDFGSANGNANFGELISIVSPRFAQLKPVSLSTLLTMMTVSSIVLISVHERERLGMKLVWSTFVVQGFLLYSLISSVADWRCFQFWGVVDQFLEIHGIYDDINDYQRYHPNAPGPQGTAQSSLGKNIGEKWGLIG